MTPPANLGDELKELLNAPSMEDRQAEHKRDIEKTINDRMVVMREVVVCKFILSLLPKSLNPFPYRELRGVSRLSSRRLSRPVWRPAKLNQTLKIWSPSPRT